MNGMETPANPHRKKRWNLWGVFAAVILCLIILSILIPGGTPITVARKNKLDIEFNQIQTAVLSYYVEYSEYPVAPDNATLIRKLSGGNLRHIEFLSVSSKDQDGKGEMIDPWGTPLRLSVDADGTLHADSAGPDKSFGTVDDIVGHFDSAYDARGK
jgi:hypothetical protein